jgi:hypothetical protein
MTLLLNEFPFMWLSNLKFVAEEIFTSDIHIAARGGRTCKCGNHNKNMVKSRL